MNRIVISVLVLLTLPACSASNPNESNAQKAIGDFLSEQLHNTPIEIVKFEKTDGQSIDEDGVRGYRFFYKTTIGFPHGYRKECLNPQNSMQGFIVATNCASTFGLSTDGIRPEPVNAVVTYEGVIAFERTENTWIAKSVSIKRENEQGSLPNDAKSPSDEMSIPTSDRSNVNDRNLDPDIITSRTWLDDGGIRLLFQPDGTVDRIKIEFITSKWHEALRKLGIESYQIRIFDKKYLVLCAKVFPPTVDFEALKAALHEASPPMSHPALLEEMTISSGQCGQRDLR